MSFVSAPYLLFLSAAFLISLLTRAGVRRAILVCLSIAFAASFGLLSPAVLLFVSVTAWLVTRKAPVGKRTAVLYTVFVCALLILFRQQAVYGRLIAFCFPGIDPAAVSLPSPIGLSFYGLAAIGYVWDVQSGRTDAGRNLLQVLLFLCLFPLVVSGPIGRTKDLMGQIEEDRKPSYDEFRKGCLLILWGFFLKLVLASRLGVVVDTVYEFPEAYHGTLARIGFLAYLVQLYCDFAGYSSIAVGSAALLGIRVPDNFRAPFLSKSVAEFWRRWHMSLSFWLRDYIYIPLGGNRKGKLRRYINLLVTFFASGIWHGSGLSFLVFGLLNAVFQIGGELLIPLRKKTAQVFRIREDMGVYSFLRMFGTYCLVSFTFLFFRAEDMQKAVRMCRSLIGLTPWVFGDGSLYRLGLTLAEAVVLLLGLLLLLFVDRRTAQGIRMEDRFFAQNLFVRAVLAAILVTAVAVFGSWGPGYDEASFIYAHF